MSDQTTESIKDNTDPQTDFETVKFLMDCAFKEATLFWNRNSVFLLANLATISASFAYLTTSDPAVEWTLRVSFGIFGVSLCTIWMLAIHAGRKMNHVWTHEARKLAALMKNKAIENALNLTPSGSVSKTSAPSATRLMYWLAAMFGLVWISITMIGNGGVI